MEKSEKALRPTKKQKELLEFVTAFIAEHGYSPSYREIMNGVGYTSVATVALHVNNLVKRGHMVKRDNSARSLEPVKTVIDLSTLKITETDTAWLFEQVEKRFKTAEKQLDQEILDEIYVLIGAVKVLGFKDQAVAFIIRLRELEAKT